MADEGIFVIHHDDADVTISDLTVDGVDSREYDYVVVVRATVTGPSGPLVVERRYEGLPRHNDVLERDAVDENDELLDRPDAVHVHTKFYGGSEGDAYLSDAHDAWLPEDRSVLSEAMTFRDASREHFENTAAAAYEKAPVEQG